MENSTADLPVYRIVEDSNEHEGTVHSILAQTEWESVPEKHREAFKEEGEVTSTGPKGKTIFLTIHKAKKITLSANTTIRVSPLAAEVEDYLGILSDLISSTYKFSRKSKKSPFPVVSLEKSVPRVHEVISLAEARNRSREWANGRGDIEGSPEFFLKIAQKFASENKLEITVFQGEQLLKQGFRLMHAVGRGSIREPTFINLAYRGNPNSEDWVAFVGKGVCFDTGGYNIKSTAGIKDMFLDKHGATSCLAAFQAVVDEKLAINVTCSIGMVENFISDRAYRPSDIITSRKGLTVEIGNTDAEGRLVLADLMHWTQEKFKTTVLIEVSTLTGAIGTALGFQYAGLFTNNTELGKALRRVGEQVHEPVWRLPVSDYHKKLITPKWSDLTNSSGKSEAGASQAAAFLKCFVEEGTKWAHLDIGGVGIVGNEGTGFGTRLLIEYARSASAVQPVKTE